MNIILINHYAGSNFHGMAFRPYYLAREWVKMGHNVTIIAASFSHLRQKKSGYFCYYGRIYRWHKVYLAAGK